MKQIANQRLNIQTRMDKHPDVKSFRYNNTSSEVQLDKWRTEKGNISKYHLKKRQEMRNR